MSDEPPHLIVEHGWKLVPVTIKPNGAEPAMALDGVSAVMLGMGRGEDAVTVKLIGLETREPLETVIMAVLACSVSV